MGVSIRTERPGDAASVRQVHEAAFATAAEASLIDRLRAHGKAVVSLVAELDGRIVGHILFSPVSVEPGTEDCDGVGVGPLAVLPVYQRHGVGARLLKEGLAACGQAGYAFAVVLGDPGFYQRFGFERASTRGLRNEYGADHAFMVVELRPGALPPAGSIARYAKEFTDLAV
jgi:putative acetyltransferase